MSENPQQSRQENPQQSGQGNPQPLDKDEKNAIQKKWEGVRVPLGIVLCFIVMLVFGLITSKSIGSNILGWNWVLVLASLTALTVILGKHSNGSVLGILISSRKVMSLSRFQTVIWTLVVLSGYLTIVFERIHASVSPFDFNSTLNSTLLSDPNLIEKLAIPDPLGVGIDWRLWAIMGISTASLVGTSLILDSKRDKKPAESATKDSSVTSSGMVFSNTTICEAKLTDIFEGDERGNSEFVDLSKVQMFLFTIVAIIAYMVSIFSTIRYTHPAFITSLPVLSEGLIAILMISHAGYLTNKSIDHTELKRDS